MGVTSTFVNLDAAAHGGVRRLVVLVVHLLLIRRFCVRFPGSAHLLVIVGVGVRLLLLKPCYPDFVGIFDVFWPCRCSLIALVMILA